MNDVLVALAQLLNKANLRGAFTLEDSKLATQILDKLNEQFFKSKEKTGDIEEKQKTSKEDKK